MKWIKKEKYKHYPEHHEERIITKFLIFPKCIDNEYRWLERVKIKQRYLELELHDCKGIFGGDSFYSTGGYWMDVEYVS